MFNFPRWGPIQREVCTGGTPSPGGLQGYNPNSASTGWGQPWNQAFHCPWIQILKHKSHVLFFHCPYPNLRHLKSYFSLCSAKRVWCDSGSDGKQDAFGEKGKKRGYYWLFVQLFSAKERSRKGQGEVNTAHPHLKNILDSLIILHFPPKRNPSTFPIFWCTTPTMSNQFPFSMSKSANIQGGEYKMNIKRI